MAETPNLSKIVGCVAPPGWGDQYAAARSELSALKAEVGRLRLAFEAERAAYKQYMEHTMKKIERLRAKAQLADEMAAWLSKESVRKLPVEADWLTRYEALTGDKTR